MKSWPSQWLWDGFLRRVWIFHQTGDTGIPHRRTQMIKDRGIFEKWHV